MKIYFVLIYKVLFVLSETECSAYEDSDSIISEIINLKTSDCYQINIENYVKVSPEPFQSSDPAPFAVKKIFDYSSSELAPLLPYFKKSQFSLPTRIISPSAL